MPKYKHEYTTFSNVVIIIGLTLINFIQILNPICCEPGAIGLGITLIIGFLELPKIFKSCSTRCHKLYDQLNNKKFYMLKVILYIGISVGTCFLYNRYNKCGLIILHSILTILGGLTYLISFIVECRNNSDNPNNVEGVFNKFNSGSTPKIISSLRNV